MLNCERRFSLKENAVVLSVIIPVYNCEKYLQRAAKSVLTQSCAEYLELIIVDDGSKDRSGEIADKIAAEYSNVKVYHQENKGVSAARNFAMSKAESLYIAFLDADDWWEPNFFDSDMLSEFSQSTIDVYCFSYRRVIKSIRYCKVSARNNSEEHYSDNGLGRYSWEHFCSFVYRCEMIKNNGIKFPDVKMGEDRVFAEKVFYLSRRIKNIDKIIFTYWANKDSSVHSTNSDYQMSQYIQAYMHFDEWLNGYQASYPVFSTVALACYIYLPVCAYNCKYKELYNTMQQYPYNLVYQYSDYDIPKERRKILELWVKHPKLYVAKYRILISLKELFSRTVFAVPPFEDIMNKLRHFKPYKCPYEL